MEVGSFGSSGSNGRTSQKVETLCLVCGDKASGRHYGVPSCDGCRGFFKRSIRRNLDYVCKESNQCVVDVSRRNQCQACRFRRCLEVNMKRDGIGAVQHERAPRGALKRSFPPEFLSTPGSAAAGSTASPPAAPAPPPPPAPPFIYSSASSLFPWRPIPSRHFPLTILAPPPHHVPLLAAHQQQVKEDEVSSSATEEMRDSADKAGPSDPALFHLNLIYQHLIDGRGEHSNDANEAAARLLFFAIRWTRTIPSFSQLSYRDQSLLLEDSWCELFVLTVAQWGLNLDELNIMRNYPDVSSDRHETLFEGLQQLRQVVTRLRLLRLDHTEFACLKALVLFKPETRGIRDVVTVEILQDQTQIMLHDYCSFGAGRTSHQHSNVGISAGGISGRFGKVLLILPALRGLQSGHIVDLFFRKLIGETPITRLLADLMMGTLF